MDYINVGEILRAQGIKGEVKIKPLTDFPERFKKLKLVYIDNKPYKIKACRFNGDFVYIYFNEVCDRDEAEALSGKLISIDRVHSVPLQEGEFFIEDIIGCALMSETGEELGIITAVDRYGAADVITAAGEGKTLRFPFLNKIVINIDTDKKLFKVHRKLLDEVCVYDYD